MRLPIRRLAGQRVLLPILTLIVLVIAWEALAQGCYAQAAAANRARASQCLIPAPTEVVQKALDSRDSLLRLHIPVTLLETALGLLIALVLGVGLAALLDYSLLLRRAIYPLLVLSQTIPIIALAPILILVFGFGLEPKVIVVVLFCFFPIAVAMIDGLTATDPDLVALLRAMGARRGQIWRMVRLPAAMPAFFSGLRIAATYAVGGAIVGEFITSEYGLGQYLRQAFNQRGFAQGFAAIVIASALSMALVGLVSLLERLALPWYFSQARSAQWDEPGIY